MNMNNNESKKHPQDVFDKDFEVIYEGDLPELPNDLGNDDYKDVLSNLSELDTTKSLGIDYLAQNRTKTFNGIVHSKNLPRHHGGRAAQKRSTASILFQGITLLLIAAVTGLLAVTFWNHKASYSDIAGAAAGHNYILGAYYGMSLFLLLIEWIAFLNVLLNTSTVRGRGMLSFVFIYLGSLLSHLFAGHLPDSPALLQGIREALYVYGGLHLTLLLLCTAGVLVCIGQRLLGNCPK